MAGNEDGIVYYTEIQQVPLVKRYFFTAFAKQEKGVKKYKQTFILDSMKSVVLYIAMSLDGYIADCKKSVNWIKGQDDSAEIQDTYSAFFDSISTVIMGKRTYDQITTELSPDKWPYSGAITYVFTHDASMADRMDIKFTSADPCKLVNKLRTGTGKNIWICGGADVINQLLKKDLIDMFHISIIPVILGGGTKLFEEAVDMINLELVNTLNYNGIIEVVYKRR